MNRFLLRTPADQDTRIRDLKRQGMREEIIATVTGRSVTDIRRTLAEPKTPRLAAVSSAAFFSGRASDTAAIAAINTPAQR